ncbi:MAG TPA: 6-phosphogluconolactonase [Candidatus Eisenbacteria bacterium]|nr:6-phosphogluconolactonase [Candidatus Eisenbacteria bacterium]
MDIRIFSDAAAVARKAAAIIAAEARSAVASRGRFVVGLSGGRTPWQMLRALAQDDLPWESVHVIQVDERVAPLGDPDRNLTHLRESLLKHAPSRRAHIYPMPVEVPDVESAAERYAETLKNIAGSPPVLDLVHLGLGPDGHTASLVPGDPVLTVTDADVAVTGIYRGRRRMTLTYPILNRARRILWIVTGADKVTALARLRAGDPTIPAGRIQAENALLLADEPAAGDTLLDSDSGGDEDGRKMEQRCRRGAR